MFSFWQSRFASQIAVAVLALAIVLTCGELASACPNCKETLAGSDPASSGVARGYYWSILFMMAMPFALMGALGSYFYYEVRKARKASAAQAAPVAQ